MSTCAWSVSCFMTHLSHESTVHDLCHVLIDTCHMSCCAWSESCVKSNLPNELLCLVYVLYQLGDTCHMSSFAWSVSCVKRYVSHELLCLAVSCVKRHLSHSSCAWYVSCARRHLSHCSCALCAVLVDTCHMSSLPALCPVFRDRQGVTCLAHCRPFPGK